jgi:bacterioferritin-associated ferredoxin
MIVCHCRVVSSTDIATAYEEGARTLSAVCRRTGAGQGCGVCIFSVRQTLCEHVEQRLAIEENTVAAS